MAVPSKTWVVISDAMVDADSPLDTTLMAGLRDDLIHLEEWLGLSYTAAQDHDHDGVNSKSVVGPAQTAGDYRIYVGSPTRDVYSTTYTKLKELKVGGGGAYRIKFDMKSLTAANTSWGQIYKNGVAVGTEWSTTLDTYTTYSEDISGFNPGDAIQIWVRTTLPTSNRVYIQSYSLSVSTPFVAGDLDGY